LQDMRLAPIHESKLPAQRQREVGAPEFINVDI
jgi:hypothetical protein